MRREPRLLYAFVYDNGDSLRRIRPSKIRNGMSRSEAGKLGAAARWGKRNRRAS